MKKKRPPPERPADSKAKIEAILSAAIEYKKNLEEQMAEKERERSQFLGQKLFHSEAEAGEEGYPAKLPPITTGEEEQKIPMPLFLRDIGKRKPTRAQ